MFVIVLLTFVLICLDGHLVRTFPSARQSLSEDISIGDISIGDQALLSAHSDLSDVSMPGTQ